MKLLRLGVVLLACLALLGGGLVGCAGITVKAPSITTEERVVVEKILARRCGYEIAKSYKEYATGLSKLSSVAVSALEGASTDADINKAIQEFVEKLTADYIASDPLLQRDVLDLAEILMPTIEIDEPIEPIELDEQLKTELIIIFKAFNEGVDIALVGNIYGK